MSITPISAPFSLRINYKSLTLTHHVDFFCDGGYNPTPGAYWVRGKQTTNWIDPATAVAAAVLLLKPFIKTTGSFLTWQLLENTGGQKIPRNSGSIGTAGTSASTETEWAENTLFFRDGNYKPVKLVMLGFAGGVVTRYYYASMGAPAQALVTSMLDTTAGHLGEWITSRGFTSLASFLAMTVSANRKSRRRLGTE